MYQKSPEDQQKIYSHANQRGILKQDPVFQYLCDKFWPKMDYDSVIKTLEAKARVDAPGSNIENNLRLLVNRQMKQKKYMGLWKKAKKYFVKKTQQQIKLEEQLQYVSPKINSETQHLSP